MDKRTLDSILKNAYNLPLWQQVLTEVFGARSLNRRPQPIINLPLRDLATEAFELGFFNTTDDRIIGLYQINLAPNTKIERNKVGLRELLRSIYKYDVDGALVVFVQNDKWRLSFISETRVLNDDGTIDKRATEPKRYTYLLGKGEKTKTPTDRLSLLTNKKTALEDIRAAFSVEALNNEFYKQISEYFYQLVGATTTRGKKTETREKTMNLPGVAADDRKTYQEFAVRLIGRTVFCWFLREKCSEQGKPLLPEKLLSSDAVRQNRNYYHEILEPLFFQTLNTPMDKRIEDLPDGCETVPFLNGGLFEPQIVDYYDFNKNSGTSNHINTLKIPDSWFEGFFKKLEEYNFTIDENSPTDVEISVDPEMLGRIFENLLAEIDPDSGETARKATGSFYTPREIVNYMVDESLLIYLKSKLLEETAGFQSLKTPQATIGGNDWRVGQAHLEYPLNENRWKDKPDELEKTLRRLFSYGETENPFDEADTKRLIRAIDECKILDPACGSGAFPIGVLQRLVYLLGKLDRKSQKWRQAQLDKIDALIANAKEFDDASIRGKVTGDLEKRRAEIERDFANKELDFGRKLFLIENCIYGVDIQPIAAEISKLRCFLTLIVDDTIDENAPNRGVNPLPNLEFKFVTADALLRLPASGLFNSDQQLKELAAVRHEYINSFGERKEAAKLHFKRIQDEIADAQVKNFRENYDRRAFELARWNPFGHERVDWFDPEWMFGVKAFDIVIGNPPYVFARNKSFTKEQKDYFYKNYRLSEYQINIYPLFIEAGNSYLKPGGVLSYITPNNWLTINTNKKLREFVLQKSNVVIVNFYAKVFESASVDSAILIYLNSKQNSLITLMEYEKGFAEIKREKSDYFLKEKDFIINIELFKNNSFQKLLQRIENKSSHLKTLADVKAGLQAYEVGKGIPTQTKQMKDERVYHSKTKLNKFYIPYLDGQNVGRYNLSWSGEYLRYGDNLASPRKDFSLFSTRRILVRQIPSKPPYCINACLTEETILNDRNSMNIINIKINPEFLLGVLNSRLISFWFVHKFGKMQRGIFPQFKINELEIFPIVNTSTENQKHIKNLVDYILFLKETDAAEQVNEYVPNSHLVEQFEEVIDALVYELYFEADFRRAQIEFHKYAATDFPPIDDLSREQKARIVHEAYQRLRQKDNPIRNNLKLMDIRLGELIMPIKTAR